MTDREWSAWAERAAIIEEACCVPRHVAERMATEQQMREEARGKQEELWSTKR